jgi:MoaA/NifB/PqqE/SkfB family radical SAM enzyme
MKFLYYPIWFIQTRIFGKKKPLQSVVFITNRCNLRCEHCCVYRGTDEPDFCETSYEDVITTFQKCYDMGSRILDIEGGEPLLWKDGDKNCSDLIDAAKNIGFFTVTITTNGQRPIDTNADMVWVSVDGTAKYHDKIRGKGSFDKLEKYISESTFPNLNCNMVINNVNYTNYKEVIKWAKETPNVHNISVNFLTPHKGVEHLKLDWDVRCEIIDELIAMKKQGYPIFNSKAGLKRMKDMNFKKFCWVSNFVYPDGTFLSECSGMREGLCDECGYAMAGEMYSVMKLKLSTILAGLKMR